MVSDCNALRARRIELGRVAGESACDFFGRAVVVGCFQHKPCRVERLADIVNGLFRHGLNGDARQLNLIYRYVEGGRLFFIGNRNALRACCIELGRTAGESVRDIDGSAVDVMGRKNKPCRVERIADKIAGFAWKRFDRNRRNNDLLPYRIERCVGVNFKHISGVVCCLCRSFCQCPADKSISFSFRLCIGKSDALIFRLCLWSRSAKASIAVIGDSVFFDGCKFFISI